MFCWTMESISISLVINNLVLFSIWSNAASRGGRVRDDKERSGRTKKKKAEQNKTKKTNEKTKETKKARTHIEIVLGGHIQVADKAMFGTEVVQNLIGQLGVTRTILYQIDFVAKQQHRQPLAVGQRHFGVDVGLPFRCRLQRRWSRNVKHNHGTDGLLWWG